MSTHAITFALTPALTPTRDPTLPLRESVAAPSVPDDAVAELSDEDLEHVVGGLTRPWDGAPFFGALPAESPLPLS